uniref:Uncharacterized protein n=1 Tax=Arundo donax TaxID=35708 RepID=A0A0A9A7Q6_ARUDO
MHQVLGPICHTALGSRAFLTKHRFLAQIFSHCTTFYHLTSLGPPGRYTTHLTWVSLVAT